MASTQPSDLPLGEGQSSSCFVCLHTQGGPSTNRGICGFAECPIETPKKKEGSNE